MKARWFGMSVMVAVIAVSAMSAPVAGQAPKPVAKPYVPPKTPWGDPDLQGTWTSDDNIGTPMSRSADFGNRLYATEEEIAAAEAQIKTRAENDLQEFVAPNARTTVNPPGHWGERARRPSRQTSLVVDPPDGRTPPLTPEGQARQAESQRLRGAQASAVPATYENF